MISFKPILALLFATAFGISAVSARQTCDSLSDALQMLATNCTALTRGDLCQDGQTTSFDGLSDFEVDTLALGQIQANYPDVAPDQYVNVVFVGGVDVQPVVETSSDELPQRVPVDVVVVGTQANVREQPVRNNTPAIAKLDDGTELNATGISRGGTWVRVQLPDQPDQPAWINKSLLQSDYDMVKFLPVVASTDPIPHYPDFTPMQAFSFNAASPCAGILMQSGNDLALLQVNGVGLHLNQATVFLQNTDDALSIDVLEGVVEVQAEDVTTISVAGTLMRVPLDSSALPSGTPEPPSPYEQAAQQRFNGSYLQRTISAAPAASADAIQDALVTPLSGRWRIQYPPPYTYSSVEAGAQCTPTTIKQHSPIFEISVSDDGSSMSTFNKELSLGTGVRAHPGLYELRDFKFQVLSPTEMTATYDTNPLAACTSIITINAQWLGPS